MIKVLLNIGPLSTYEELAQERGGHHRRRGEAQAGHQAPGCRAGSAPGRAGGGQARDDRQAHAPARGRTRKKANQHVAQQMEAILDVALAELEQPGPGETERQLPHLAVAAGTGKCRFDRRFRAGMLGPAVRALPAVRPSPARSRG